MSVALNKIPEGSKHLFGALFAVPFASIRVPDTSEEAAEAKYKFSNPRMNTEAGQSDLLDKRLSAELRENIKARTLLCPLVCRWVQDGDKLYPQLVGGDRRYRALDFLIRKKEIVTDPRNVKTNDAGEWEYSQCSAHDAYEFVPCQIFQVNNDLDALALAWAENKSRINLSEGAEVAEVIKLRKTNATDERILEILQQDEKWLADTDSLIANLDVDSLGDLLEGRIDRSSAFELLSIEDTDVRGKVRTAANELAAEACKVKVQRLRKQVLDALESREIAQGAVADATFQNDNEAVAEAKAVVADAEKKVKRTIAERDEATTPVTTAKEVKKAKRKDKAERKEGDDDNRPLKMLGRKEISAGIDYLEEMIANAGKSPDSPEGSFTAPIDLLKLVKAILNNNILANEPNFEKTIRRYVVKTTA